MILLPGRSGTALPRSLRRMKKFSVVRRSIATTSRQPEIYDVVCIGGGPVGLSIVTALSKP